MWLVTDTRAPARSWTLSRPSSCACSGQVQRQAKQGVDLRMFPLSESFFVLLQLLDVLYYGSFWFSFLYSGILNSSFILTSSLHGSEPPCFILYCYLTTLYTLFLHYPQLYYTPLYFCTPLLSSTPLHYTIIYCTSTLTSFDITINYTILFLLHFWTIWY